MDVLLPFLMNDQRKAYDLPIILGDKSRCRPMPKILQQLILVIGKRRWETERVNLGKGGYIARLKISEP